MMGAMALLTPVFIQGDLSLIANGNPLEFLCQKISSFGVTGLPWEPLHPDKDFGKQVQAQITLSVEGGKLQFQTAAHLLRESTPQFERMGVRFLLEPDLKIRLESAIQKYGYYPTEAIRKYPRIPSNPLIQVFPSRAQVWCPEIQEQSNHPERWPIGFDVANLSPGGILLSTENQLGFIVQPGTKLKLLIEPRGWFPMPIQAEGTACRIVDDLDPQSGNMIRYLGIRFSKLDELNRAGFLNLLKEILERIKQLP